MSCFTDVCKRLTAHDTRALKLCTALIERGCPLSQEINVVTTTKQTYCGVKSLLSLKTASFDKSGNAQCGLARTNPEVHPIILHCF